MLSFNRKFSQLLKKDPSGITVELVKLHAPDSTKQHRISLIQAINNSTNEHKIPLFEELIPDFSLYFDLKNQALSNELAGRFIGLNSERVFLNLEIFNGVQTKNDHLVETLLKTLIGKSKEQDRQVEVLKEVGSILKEFKPMDDVLISIFENLNSDGLYVQEYSPLKEILHSKLSTTTGLVYLNIFDQVLENSTVEEVLKALDIITKQDLSAQLEKESRLRKDLNLEDKQVNIDNLLRRALSYVESIDLDSKSLELRIRLVEIYGINISDMQKALEIFNKHKGLKDELIQQALLKSFVYQSIRQNDKNLLKIADTLVQELTIRTLQLLMIGQANFSLEDSLALYNDYIKEVSKEINLKTNRSSLGLLTETLILSNLYDNDREFAQLLFEKAVQNEIVTGEFEIAQLKGLFKVYGDAYEGDSWDKAKVILKDYVLGYVRRL